MFLCRSGCISCLLVGVSMYVAVGCLWFCIYAIAWIADDESVIRTMLFMHGGLVLSKS